MSFALRAPLSLRDISPKGGDAKRKSVPPPLKGEGDRGRGFPKRMTLGTKRDRSGECPFRSRFVQRASGRLPVLQFLSEIAVPDYLFHVAQIAAFERVAQLFVRR